jgi:diguanylate cyclase (GGDEF)-like protein
LKLRTRIGITFFALLAAVLAATLGWVSIQNRHNAEREVQQQLSAGGGLFLRTLAANRRQLQLAARAVAYDYAFRKAVALRDDDTLASVVENSADRMYAKIVVLTSLDGRVIASYGSRATAGQPFPILKSLQDRRENDPGTTVLVEDGRFYQLVAAPVNLPLPVAWITMGIELDAQEFADLTGLIVTLSVKSGDTVSHVSAAPLGSSGRSDLAPVKIPLSGNAFIEVAGTAESLAAARKPFENLTNTLILIAATGLIGSAVAVFWLTRGITRPLRDLTDAVDQIRAGTYDAPVPVRRDDELGTLAKGLQFMQAAVHSRDVSIRRLAFEDTLTGLMNRTAYDAALTASLSTLTDPIAVAVIDLHRFRRINEHLGYSVGDAVLREIATRLRVEPNAATAVARLAADKFAAFVPLRAGATATAWGADLLARLADPVVVETQPIDISATVGLALAPADAMLADDLLRCADLALDRARREKRPLALYEPALKPAARDQLSLLGELRKAVDQDELRLYFQPKIELATNRVAGAEVLLRWQHPVRGLLGPGAFIPFAEQTGFIRRITQWTLEHAVAQSAAWHTQGMSLPLAVNVSADDIGDARFDFRVASTLTRHRLPPGLLTLEVTETGFIDDPQQALRMLEALATLGVLLSIDDFGTGYSSLSHLARMPVHEVKIDQSFVKGLESDAEFVEVVRSAIEMGHSLGLKVVAEGIETEAAAQTLRKMGCDIAQGYLYAKPMARADLETWLADKVRAPVVAAPAEFTLDAVTDTAIFATF